MCGRARAFGLIVYIQPVSLYCEEEIGMHAFFTSLHFTFASGIGQTPGWDAGPFSHFAELFFFSSPTEGMYVRD